MLYIFDWDGTLSQSLDHIVASIDCAARQAGLPVLSLEEQQAVIGLGLEEALSELYPQADSRQRQLWLDAYRESYLLLDQESPSPLYEGVEETLEHLLTQGHKLAVATGKARRGLDRVMTNAGISHVFSATRCVDEARSKPHPLMLNQLLELTGFSAADALMVGDTDFDLLMANEAGISAVGVTYGAHPITRLQACRPQRLIADIRELRQSDAD